MSIEVEAIDIKYKNCFMCSVFECLLYLNLKMSLICRSEPAGNVSKILEQNRCLQDENSKLSRELSEAVGQTALMFERIIMVRIII